MRFGVENSVICLLVFTVDEPVTFGDVWVKQDLTGRFVLDDDERTDLSELVEVPLKVNLGRVWRNSPNE